MAFLNALPGAVAEGLIWGLMAIGVYISYKILDIADLTVDGSICTGACVCAVLMAGGCPAIIAVLVAFLAGMMIIPAVFTFMGEEGMAASGPALMFVALPKVFGAMGPVIGTLVGILFFLTVAFAALTSSVSILEWVDAFELAVEVYDVLKGLGLDAFVIR